MRSAILFTLYPPSREHPPRVVDEAHAHQWWDESSDGRAVSCVSCGQTRTYDESE